MTERKAAMEGNTLSDSKLDAAAQCRHKAVLGRCSAQAREAIIKL